MSEWILRFDGWLPDEEPMREALCALGNGYVVTRGAAEEYAAGGAHYPGTYLAGGYDRLVSDVAGRAVAHEDLVNWPNWLPLTFRPDEADGEWLDPDRWTILEYRRTLDLQRGILVRRMRVRDPAGRVTALRSRRLAHMSHPHLLAMEWELTPENWAGPLVIRSALDGTVDNGGVERYDDLDGQHLVPVASGVGDDGVLELLVEARQSGLRVALAGRTTVSCDAREQTVHRTPDVQEGYAGEELRLSSGPGRTLCVEKVVAICTGRDRGIGEPRESAARMVRAAPGFAELLRTHALAWRQLWRRGDTTLAGAPEAQRALRLDAFHLLQTVSPHTVDLDVGLPARGWHGEAWRGHASWDELFAFPYLVLRFPDVARALLLYRWRRLGEARSHASALGHRGALFPWRSASEGRDVTRTHRPAPGSAAWVADHSRLQYHVNGAVALDVWRYHEATDDVEFLAAHGAEILVETARFWASLAERDPADGRHHLRGVVGPDPLHDAWPDADRPGVDDDLYTNVLASWTLRAAERVLALLPADRAAELRERLAVGDEELARWREVGATLAVHLHDDGIPSLFAGYGELAELGPDVREALRARHGSLRRLDDALAGEGDTARRYRVSAMPGALLLLCLFSAAELAELLGHLGQRIDAADVPRIARHYLERMEPGSALGAVVRSWALARLDRERSWEQLEAALESSTAYPEGGTTAEGIHLGAMAATLDMVQRCFLGVEMLDGVLHLDPCLPEPLDEMGATVRHRGQWLSLRVTRDTLTVRCREGLQPAARIAVGGEVVELGVGEERSFELGVGSRA